VDVTTAEELQLSRANADLPAGWANRDDDSMIPQLLEALLLFSLTGTGIRAADPPARPNVIFHLADDPNKLHYPRFIDLIIGSGENLLGWRVTESQAKSLLTMIGWVYIIPGIAILIRPLPALLWWTAIWALVTARHRSLPHDEPGLGRLQGRADAGDSLSRALCAGLVPAEELGWNLGESFQALHHFAFP